MDKQAQGTKSGLSPHGDRRKEPVLDLAVPVDQQAEEAYDGNDGRWMGKTASSVKDSGTQIAEIGLAPIDKSNGGKDGRGGRPLR